MNIIVKLIALLVLTMASFAAQSAERRVTGGVIKGEELSDGSAIFRSIPFAAPPTGRLRWKPPQPVLPWQGVRDVNAIAKPCMQDDEGWNAADAAISSEDCLYLSVHEPKHASGERLPVYVWIHGGSNRAGNGHDVADSLIYQHGIVLVTIEYRLGIFGFLASPQLTRESPHHSSGNYALLDQIAALKWVQKNIATFGGDARNVTIGGQSAGAMDIGQLLRSPLAKGLFSKTIQESGVLAPPRSAADNESIGRQLLTNLQLPGNAVGLKQLRALPASALLAASKNLKPVSGDPNLLWMETSADGWVIPAGRNNLYKSDDVSHVPHLVGNTTQEFIFEGNSEAVRGLVTQAYGSKAEAALGIYGIRGEQLPPDDAKLGDVGTQVLTDWTMRCPAYQLNKWTMANKRKVWRYEFGLPRPGSKRVEHTAELDYVYYKPPAGATSLSWPPLQQYWANFIKTGDPNDSSLPHWPEMNVDADYLLFLPSGMSTGKDLHGSHCRLLAQRFAGE
ncbi:MAG TPA: carboxylesterase family protein [Steroidobacteraceae bacterium]|nr:carboxylesterase family protein [Steroidobacteraceae bacterium]